MKLQLQMFVYEGYGLMKLNSYKCLYRIGLMDLPLQMFVYDRVDETTATNVCI